jgi:hypothetical protein
MSITRSDISVQSYGRTPTSHLLGSSRACTTCDPEAFSPSGHDASPSFSFPATTTFTSPVNELSRVRMGHTMVQHQQSVTPPTTTTTTPSHDLNLIDSPSWNSATPEDDPRPPPSFLLSAASRPSVESRPTASGLFSLASALAFVCPPRPSPLLPYNHDRCNLNQAEMAAMASVRRNTEGTEGT